MVYTGEYTQGAWLSLTHSASSVFRHPSYAGFFYYSIGTQIALQNPLSAIGYTLVLYRFFSRRIRCKSHRPLYMPELKVFRFQLKKWRLSNSLATTI